MKIFLALGVVLSSLSAIEACHGCVESTNRNSDDPFGSKRISSSKLQQMSCVKESSAPNHDSFDLTIVEDGTPYNCVKLSPTDSDFDHMIKYPVAPPKPDGSPESFSYTRLGSENEMIVNCIQPGTKMDEIIFSAAKGYFPVLDVKQNKKFICIRLAVKLEGLLRRVARALSKSC